MKSTPVLGHGDGPAAAPIACRHLSVTSAGQAVCTALTLPARYAAVIANIAASKRRITNRGDGAHTDRVSEATEIIAIATRVILASKVSGVESERRARRTRS